VTSLLARGAQAHQAALVSHLTPYDPAYVERLRALKSALGQELGGHAAAQAAPGILYRQLLDQSQLLAYVNNFRLLALLCALSIPLVLLFKKARRGPVAAAH